AGGRGRDDDRPRLPPGSRVREDGGEADVPGRESPENKVSPEGEVSDCLFCRIASGEIPSKKVYADDRIYAFHDIAPKAPTHVLVVPRRHIAKLADAGAEDREIVGEVVARAAAIARDLGL